MYYVSLGVSMVGFLVKWLALIGQCYRYFVDSPIKQTMPIFTEWLIPEALGLHTEIWLQAAPSLLPAGPGGFHRHYRLGLGVREREEAQARINWEVTRIEVWWRVPRAFFIDPWQLERQLSQELYGDDDGPVQYWIEWNTEDLKATGLDVEAAVFSPRATEFTLKASIFARKRWNVTVEIPDLMVRYQDPRLGVAYLEELTFPKPKIRLVSVDPSRRPPAFSVQYVGAEIPVIVPVGVYHSAIPWVTIIAVSSCSLLLFSSILQLI